MWLCLAKFGITCSRVDFFWVDRPSLRTYLDSPLSPRTTKHRMVLYFSFNSPTLRVYDGFCYHLCPRLKMVSTFQVKRRRLDQLNAVLCRLVAYHFFPICLGFRFARLFDFRRRKINVFFHVFSVVGQVGLKRNSRKPESHRLQVPTALTYCDTILVFSIRR